MTYPDEVTAATVTVPADLDTGGGVAYPGRRGQVAITEPVRHLASGERIVPRPLPVTSGADGTATFTVPHSDQPGFDRTAWTYELRWAGGETVRFAVPSAAGPDVSLADLVDSPDVPGVAVPLAVGPPGPPGPAGPAGAPGASGEDAALTQQQQDALAAVQTATNDTTPRTLVRRDDGGGAEFSAVGLYGQPNPWNATRRDYVEAGSLLTPLPPNPPDTVDNVLTPGRWWWAGDLTPEGWGGGMLEAITLPGLVIQRFTGVDSGIFAVRRWWDGQNNGAGGWSGWSVNTADPFLGSAAADPDTVVRRDGTGGVLAKYLSAGSAYIDWTDPGSPSSLTRKDYVDGAIAAVSHGLDASTFTSVAMTRGSQLAGAVFVTVPLDTVVGGWPEHWDPDSQHYVVPATGTYLCLAKVRPADGSPQDNLGMGVDIGGWDSPSFQWGSPGAATRYTENYQRIDHFDAGDRLRLFVYWDSGNDLSLTNAALSVVRLF